MDPAFKERVTAAFDGLAARYDTERGGFVGPVSDLLVRAAGLRPGQAVLDAGFDAVLASNVMFLLTDPANPSMKAAGR